MLRHVYIAIVTMGLTFLPVMAQDASNIAKVRDGNTCTRCNLFQADFSYQGIRNIDLSGSRLRQADLSLSTMDGVDFTDADLSVANLFGGRFSHARFVRADITSATLVGAWFGGADFSGANLTGANLSGAYLKTAKGLTNQQLATACGDEYTLLPDGINLPHCR